MHLLKKNCMKRSLKCIIRPLCNIQDISLWSSLQRWWKTQFPTYSKEEKSKFPPHAQILSKMRKSGGDVLFFDVLCLQGYNSRLTRVGRLVISRKTYPNILFYIVPWIGYKMLWTIDDYERKCAGALLLL